MLDFYHNNQDFVKPVHRFNEIKAFVKDGLRDFSISRVKEKMPWGVEVHGLGRLSTFNCEAEVQDFSHRVPTTMTIKQFLADIAIPQHRFLQLCFLQFDGGLLSERVQHDLLH